MTHKQQNFSVEAPAGSDIWKKPPSTDVWSAPTTLDQSHPMPLSNFQSTRITFKGTWVHKFDQAGIILVMTDGQSKTWIKAGLEYYDGKPCISFVGCDRFADWSVHSVEGPSDASITVELRREGFALWAYQVILDSEGREVGRHPFRECTWLWADEGQKQLQIGAYCARPAKGTDLGPLKVDFKELLVEAKDV